MNKDTHFENGYYTLQKFSEKITTVHQVSDGLLTARIIGEFSAGKTRFLREFLGDTIPPSLYPVSSLERQTRLPLEITYGLEPELTLVHRANDYDLNDRTITLQTLTEFPDREATMQHNPLQHRLRLSIPDNRLILKNGDGYSEDKSAKRLFLIDMPGWNSGDDQLAEGDASEIMAGFHNLALIYVVSAVRIDGLKNSERLSNFLQTFAKAEFVGDPHLIIMMTHCPTSEAEALQEKVKRQVNTMWNELGETSSLSMALFSIDFEEVSHEELISFRNKFWLSLLSPLKKSTTEPIQHSWNNLIHCWPKDWVLNDAIVKTQELLAKSRLALTLAFQDNNYIVGMNMTKLSGLDTLSIQKRLHEHWDRQMREYTINNEKLINKVPKLDGRHPLADYWNMYYIPYVEKIYLSTTRLLEAIPQTFNEITPNTPDLQVYLSEKLDKLYNEANDSVFSSFTQILDSLKKLPENTTTEKILATLLQLSLIQMRYQDHLEGNT